MDLSVVLLGTRGSVPVSGEAYQRYGGASSCVLVRLAGEQLVLDAGTGLVALPDYLRPETRKFTLLLTHAHADHILGLPVSPLFYDPGIEKDVRAVRRGGLSPQEQACALMHEPLWPASTETLRAVSYHDIEGSFRVGEVAVDAMESDHPGGSTVYRLSAGDRSLVYATDFEHGPRSAALEDFARGCTLLLYDAQFDDSEYPAKRGWGHSTWQEGAALAQRAGAQRLVFVHHAPTRTDDELDALGRALKRLPIEASFGRDGEEIDL